MTLVVETVVIDLLTKSQTITDPAEWDGSLFGTQLELVQLAGGEFQSSQIVTELGGIQLLRLSVNQPITVRSRPLSLRYVATSFDRPHDGHFAGAAIEADKLLIMPPAFDFDACVKDSGFHCSTVFAPPEQLRLYYQTLVGQELEEMDGLTIAQPASSSLQWLATWPELVRNDLYETFTAQQRLSIHETLRDEALTFLINALRASSASEPLGETPRFAKARQLVRLAEDFANNSPDISVRMIDLCEAAGVSERTLQYAFQTCLGISPINYLKRLRLHQVRRELKSAAPKETTVSAIACQFGFFHFSDFAQAYKAQFDETPSQTLRRS